MTDGQEAAQWDVAESHGKMLVDRNGEKIGKLQDVYVDVETDEPQFATVKEGFLDRHLTFSPSSLWPRSKSVLMICRSR
jgi:sporulation protein YlmC with PRC-barrel domain